MALIVILSLLATRGMKLLPSGFQNFMEASIGFLYDQVVEIAGEKNGRRFFAVIATFFIFIIVSNWTGLLPFFNAIGKSEDVGHEIFHEISEHDEDQEPFEEEDFAGWLMEESGNWVVAGNRAENFELEIPGDRGRGRARPLHRRARRGVYGLRTRRGCGRGAAPTSKKSSTPRLPSMSTRRRPIPPGRCGGESTAEAAQEDEHAVESPALGVVRWRRFPRQEGGARHSFFRSVFSDVNNTLALGICSFIFVEFWGFQALGLGYLRKFFVNPFKNPIGTFVGFLELLSELIRVVSFTFRLFGNIFAGEVLILMLTFLAPFLIVDIIYGLELFVGFIQAAVFALLTLVFATMAVEHHGDEEHHDGDASAEPHQAGHQTGAAQAH
jgi:F0F1-type ATP synthase membrane subunit a